MSDTEVKRFASRHFAQRKKKRKKNTSVLSQWRHSAQMPIRWVSAAGRYLPRGLLCQWGKGPGEATWRLPSSCCTATVAEREKLICFLQLGWAAEPGSAFALSSTAKGRMLVLPKGGAAHLQTPGLGLECLSKLAANPSQLHSSAAVTATVISIGAGGWSSLVTAPFQGIAACMTGQASSQQKR